jgi:hypothetical protein
MTKTIEAEEFRLVDARGNLRARLGFDGERASFEFRTPLGRIILQLTTSDTDTALQMYEESSEAPRIELSIDAQGSHVHLATGESQESYLFLKRSGATGLVLTDSMGRRKTECVVSPEGAAGVSIWDATGLKKSLA